MPAVKPDTRFSTDSPDAAAGYQPQFDSLRAIAVLTVTSDHFAAAIRNFPLPDSIHLGPIAVRLFLVLSGYFITASLQRTRSRMEAGRALAKQALGAFYMRRFLRIAPPYGMFVIVGLALNLGAMRHNIFWIATFTVNLLIAWTGEWPLAISHLWSICVQEQFYVFWPLLILFLPRRQVFKAIVCIAAAGMLFRVGCVTFSAPLLARWVLPFGSLDALAGGSALAWSGQRLMSGSCGRPWAKLAGGAVSMLALTAAGILRNGDQTRLISVLVEPLEVGALVWVVARTHAGWGGWAGRILAWRGLLYAGRISYGIYIYHILVGICFDQWTPRPWRWIVEIPLIRLVTLTAATLMLSAISWQLLEEPINRWRRSQYKSNKAPSPIPVAS